MYNNTVAGTTGALVTATNETCVAIAEIDLTDGSSNAWLETTCA